MVTTLAQIDLWLRGASEHQRLEFKEAKNQFDSAKLNRYCVALANEGGGTLILGVTDKPPRRIVGTQAFLDPVGTAEKLFCAVGFRVYIEEVAHAHGRVLVFHVPGRPRGTAYHLDGAYLMRSGEQLVPMSEDRLRAIFAEGQPDWLEEHAKRGLSDHMTNQSLRERFRLPESASATASQVIAATIESGLVKPDERVGTSRKYARYLPFWA
jgi:ATP-dependent DNA helicase RecG